MSIQKIFTKKNILTLLAVIAYFFVMVRSIWGGYDTIGLISATLGGHTEIVFLLTLLAIERQDTVRKPYFYYTIIGIVGILSLLAFSQGIWKGLGIIARNSAYLLYGRITRSALINQKKISLRLFTTSGLSLFSILLSIGYVMVFLSYTRPFDIDCDNLKQQTLGIMTQYFPSSLSSNNTLLTTIEQFGNKTLGQLVGVGSGNLNLSGSESGAITLHTGTLLGTIEIYKKSLIDDFIANKTIIDQGVCDFTLAHIQKITTNSTFQISAAILLTLLILVFINTLFIIFGIVVFLIIILLYKTKVYTITTRKQDCEKLS